MSKTYIALDLETTGFDPIADQVIEIAAIKFKDGKIIDQFETLINPGVPIPSMITHITGIKAEDLVDSPTFKTVKDKLVEFIDDAPIIGHNIAFDVTFLNQKGCDLKNDLYDTVQLAGILIPGLASYSLDTITRHLKIGHENKHRAMSDTKACMDLYLLLIKKIEEIDAHTMEQILKVLDKSHWELKDVFESVKPSKKKHHKKESKPKEHILTGEFNLDEKQLLDLYENDGQLSKLIKAKNGEYEKRDAQPIFTKKILESFENSRGLIVEAGTGTGKTMAYLLAASYYSLKENTPIIISTHTKNLQEQILHRELPMLESIFDGLNLHIKTAVLKGRRNYLSVKRLEKLLEKDFFEDHEATFLIKILLWLNITENGDLDEISIQNKEGIVLEDICCNEFGCPHEIEAYKQGCFLMRARQKAEKANLIVINHSLLMQDAIAESPLLPEYDYLVIDEAHHLEKIATDTYTQHLAFNFFHRPFEKLHKFFEEITFSNAAGVDTYFHQIKELKLHLQQIISRIDIFFGLIGILMEKSMDPNQFQYQLNLKPVHFATPDWGKVIDAANSTEEIGKKILLDSQELLDKLKPLIELSSAQEAKNNIYECERRLQTLQNCLSNEALQQNVTWVYKAPDPVTGTINLKSAPLNVGPNLVTHLYKKKKSIIMASATLRTDNSFAFFREQLDLHDKFDELALPSHFNFPDQVKIVVAEDIEEPNTEGYFYNCANIIANTIKKNGGRTLVLFTSKKALSATYHQIAPKLKEEGFTVLAQNITGGRGKIIEHFKDEPDKCAILGTASFWEGVDIPGNDLNCVIMQKLPFDPPDDPLIVARCQKYSNSFNQYQLPRAILKFKQGFGRLIRTSRDTGSIIILDSRIVQKSYGPKFLQSLPEGIKIEYKTKSELAS